MFREIGARLENSPCTFLAKLTQQALVLKTTAWRVTKNLHLWPYKMIRLVLGEQQVFLTNFCGQYMVVFLT
jgi:hypothetical protein